MLTNLAGSLRGGIESRAMKSLLVFVGILLFLLFFRFLTFLTRRHNKVSPRQVADWIENFLEGKGGSWDWDDFISLPINDPELDKIRLRCCDLSEEFPPGENEDYCSEEGVRVMREYIRQLRQQSADESSDQSGST